MQTIFSVYDNLKAVKQDEIFAKAIEETSPALVEKNRERMEDGIKADGSEMPIYSYISQTVYGYPNTRIKLHATGAFQAAIHVEVNGDIVHTDSFDDKSKMLKDRYGEEIFGLSSDHIYDESAINYFKKPYLDESLQPAIVRGFKKAIGIP